MLLQAAGPGETCILSPVWISLLYLPWNRRLSQVPNAPLSPAGSSLRLKERCHLEDHVHVSMFENFNRPCTCPKSSCKAIIAADHGYHTNGCESVKLTDKLPYAQTHTNFPCDGAL